jgi:beta-N-acetylhexosaminidase
MDLSILKLKPFCLGDEDTEWIKTTIESMTDDEKIGQLFCMVSYAGDTEEFLHAITDRVKAGGVMCRKMAAGDAVALANTLQRHSNIPMLIAANLESGADGVINEGVKLGSPMQIAATGDTAMAEKLGIVCAKEGAAVGVNWLFAPIVDIDYNFRNPITNTRTFGSDPRRVSEMGRAYITAAQKLGVAACAKHFPGDGVDERDHHLVSSVNDLSVEQWDECFGKIYRACIDAGVWSIMVGHIIFPAYVRKLNPNIKDQDMLPASLSKEIITGLLRNILGFNGLIVSDATTMAGMNIAMPREKVVPACIAAGCDMFLFTKNMEEDIFFMKQGVERGIITSQRIHEALIRILGMKAALGLNKKRKEGSLIKTPESVRKYIGIPEHQIWADECADKGITLVKEEAGVLPLSPEKYKRILLYALESQQGYQYSVKVGAVEELKKRLSNEGFDIELFDPIVGQEGRLKASSEFIGKFDLIMYVANIATRSNQTSVRIEWSMPMGIDVPIYITSIPTIFISLENPYHLLDVPRIRTFINTYNSSNYILDNLVKKLMGRSAFKGINPSDPFCGKWDTHL